jgi:rare lipoprotein A (peptidoglycan hydrolase)
MPPPRTSPVLTEEEKKRVEAELAARRHTRRGVRDKLLASPNLSRKDVDHSAETGRSFENSGIASVYGGQRTANGETMYSGEMTAAHRTLPFGTKVTVVNRRNGRSAVVRINDRGPFVRGRVTEPLKGRHAPPITIIDKCELLHIWARCRTI